jgi:uncharacterized protein (DUF952 family)
MHATVEAKVIYKICTRGEWQRALGAGSYEGSQADRTDGYIHFSTYTQLQGTVEKHFRNRTDLVLVAVDATLLGPALRWEPARGGALFPHLYGPLDVAAALAVEPLALGHDGVPQLPESLR